MPKAKSVKKSQEPKSTTPAEQPAITPTLTEEQNVATSSITKESINATFPETIESDVTTEKAADIAESAETDKDTEGETSAAVDIVPVIPDTAPKYTPTEERIIHNINAYGDLFKQDVMTESSSTKIAKTYINLVNSIVRNPSKLVLDYFFDFFAKHPNFKMHSESVSVALYNGSSITCNIVTTFQGAFEFIMDRRNPRFAMKGTLNIDQIRAVLGDVIANYFANMK